MKGCVPRWRRSPPRTRAARPSTSEPVAAREHSGALVPGRAALVIGGESRAAQHKRASVLSHRDWLAAHHERTRLRHAWRAFFENWDVLLCPVAPTPAFPHDHSEDRDARQLLVDGEKRPYWDQLFWSGIAGLCYLPATVAPAGRTAAGLPVGIQIIGPEFGDRTTIEFARLLGEAIGGFTPPPGFG